MVSHGSYRGNREERDRAHTHETGVIGSLTFIQSTATRPRGSVIGQMRAEVRLSEARIGLYVARFGGALLVKNRIVTRWAPPKHFWITPNLASVVDTEARTHGSV